MRLFAAIELPPDIGEALLTRQHGVEGARWRPLESLHITLRFFGETSAVVADDLDAQLAVITAAPFDLSLQGAGLFGEGADMRALWVGVAPSEPLRLLAGRCESAARRSGLKAEGRAWRPHVTLAYLSRANPLEAAAWVQAHNLARSPPFRVDRFGLYSSWPSHAGSAYRLETTYRL